MQITPKTSTIHTTLSAKRKIDYIVVHYTAGTTSKAGTAINTANYFETTSTEVSADFIVDDGEIVQYNPDIQNRYSWHCGGAKYGTKGGSFYGKCTNANSIGIEICSTNSTGRMQNANDRSYSFTQLAVDNAAALVKQLMVTYSVPAERVIRHYDVNGKPCPGIYGWNTDSGSEAEWNSFKQRIEKAPAARYTVQVGAFSDIDNARSFCKLVQKYFSQAFVKELDGCEKEQ
jgi:N-acetylmuramoyl-L-alanine amidase CwlA